MGRPRKMDGGIRRALYALLSRMLCLVKWIVGKACTREMVVPLQDLREGVLWLLVCWNRLIREDREDVFIIAGPQCYDLR